MKARSLRMLLMATCAMAALPFICRAGDLTLRPSVSLGGRYDDNVYFSNVRTEDDFIAVISTRLGLAYTTERSALSAEIHAAIAEIAVRICPSGYGRAAERDHRSQPDPINAHAVFSKKAVSSDEVKKWSPKSA